MLNLDDFTNLIRSGLGLVESDSIESLALTEAVLVAEDHFGIQFTDAELRDVFDLSDLHHYVVQRWSQKS